MKIVFILLVSLLFQTLSYAQMHDNVWTFGYTCIPGDSSRFGGTNLYFDDGIIGEYVCRDIRFQSNCNASISDYVGNLQLMFNGCTLNNANNEIVEGNEKLVRNDTDIEQTWWCDDGYNNPSGAMFLPDPYDEDKYYLFYRDLVMHPVSPYYVSDSFYVAEIIKEDQSYYVGHKRAIVADTVSLTGLSAIRHANGKDWWVMVKNQHDNIFHNILVDEQGPQLVHNQKIGNLDELISNGSTTKASPDGKYLATFDPFFGLEILSFDRASGQFAEYNYVDNWINVPNNIVADVEFSPSGQYLYVAEVDTLWQFDMTLAPEDFFDSKVIIGTYDGFLDPFPVNFWLMQTAPDGKIYMSARNSAKFLHVIHNPNESGLECDFQQHGFELPTVNARGMPYFPNYRLGPDSTWVSTNILTSSTNKIYPNPATNTIQVTSDHDIEHIIIYSAAGDAILRSQDTGIDISTLPEGKYFVHIIGRDGGLGVEKLVVMR